MDLLLYTTSACHLCEQAEALLAPVLAYVNSNRAKPIVLCKREITESAELVERYGIRIPVIRFRDSAQELGWPFDQAEAFAFIGAQAEN